MNREYALQLYATAMEFYQVYPVLKADANQRHDFIGVKHYNLCHALELTLKGWLAYTGDYSEKQLGQKFGHDLKRVANKVRKIYSPIPQLDACRGYILTLNADYFGKSYEYPMNAGRLIGLADHAGFAAAVEDLIHALAKTLQSGKFPEKPLPVDPVQKSFLEQLGDVIVRFGLWLKKLAS